VWVDDLSQQDVMSEFSSLKKIATGGDTVPPHLLEKMAKVFSNISVYQFYGPTEAVLFGVCNTEADSSHLTIP
jgi:acyl-CoA synthetase (AMP-forming)/AMP-acid ligase II